jgi:hypothetical protein
MSESETNVGDSSPADRLIGALLEGGEEIDEGQFTLDPIAAARKLEAFAYTHREEFLVPIVEGLIGLGAQRIAIETHSEDLVIRCPRLALERVGTRFAELYVHVFGSHRDPVSRAWGRLAVGIDMVLGDISGERVELAYSDESTSMRAEYRFRKPPELRVCAPQAGHQLRVVIDRAWTRTPTEARNASLRALLAAVKFSPIRVTLDADLVSRQPRNWWGTVVGEGPGYRFSAGLNQDVPSSTSEYRSVVELWSNAVCIERMATKGFAFVAAIELDAPRRDLSQRQVVRDEQLQAAWVAGHAAQRQLLEALERADMQWTTDTRPIDWPLVRVDRVLGRKRTDVSETASGERKALQASVSASMLEHYIATDDENSLNLAMTVIGMLCLVVGASAMWGMGEGWGVLVAGAVLFSLGVGRSMAVRTRAARAYAIREHGTRTRARVTEIEAAQKYRRESGSPAIPLAHVRWSFTDAAGVSRVGKSVLRDLPEARAWQGRQITVFFDPAAPDECWWEADIGPRSNADSD